MMQVVYSGTWDDVVEAIAHANRLLSQRELYERIRAVAKFDLTDATPHQVAEAMERCTARLTVQLYKSWWPQSKTIGYEDARFPDIVFMNTRRLNRSVASIVGTIIHEAVHVADVHSPLDFGHGDNRALGKDTTAPYWIGNLAISMVSGEAFALVDHAPAGDLEDEQKVA